LSRTLYLDIQLAAGAVFELPPLAAEMALYAVDGGLVLDGEQVAARSLVVLETDLPVTLVAHESIRLMVIGGDALPERRFMWWNFVSSRKARIAQAARDWDQQAMGRVAGDDELIPLPERRLMPD
jgi:redox-sensitive bicupin YhaK (pirin superfamily)